jgi:hypothetical protein
MPDSNDFVYVQYGCGPSAGEGWLNFDSSLTLRIERIPVIGALVSRRFSGNTWRFPPSVQYGDICKLLLLAPGGTFRLIVPDLEERAKRYVERAATGTPDAAGRFLDSSGLGQEHRPRTPLQHIRQMMGGSKHLWMWDEYSMADELRKVNFVNIRRCEFGDSTDPMFSRVEQQGRFFDEELGIRECALEARKPV